MDLSEKVIIITGAARPMDLSEKVIIITGAARGLGQTYAKRFAELGAHLVVCDRRDCDQTVARCQQVGAEAIGFETDVTDAASARTMAERALARFGRIDVLINNAALFGSLRFSPFDKLDEAEWDATMSVNVKGIWHCCRAVVPAMRDAGGGAIINISSLAAIYGMPNGLHYTTSKAAVIGLTRGQRGGYGSGRGILRRQERQAHGSHHVPDVIAQAPGGG
jgi:3-oxoacyl-[acyl-carrier protein] reductase